MAKDGILGELKFRKLQRRLPDEPLAHLLGHLDLMWMTAWASGVVAFSSRDDAEVAAGWDGEPGKWADVLITEGWIDETDLGLEIHDWWDHAPDYVKKRKDMLLLALSRGYEGIRDQWLRDRGISRTPVDQRLTIGRPVVDQQSTNGPLYPTQPNPTQPLETSAPAQAGEEVKGKVLELRPETTPATRKPKATANPDVKRLIDHYHAEFVRLRGQKPVIRGAVAGEAAKTLLTGRSFDEAADLVSEFLRRPPEWNATKGLLRLEDIPAAAVAIMTRASPTACGRAGRDGLAPGTMRGRGGMLIDDPGGL